jgi:hypothetical protein
MMVSIWREMAGEGRSKKRDRRRVKNGERQRKIEGIV